MRFLFGDRRAILQIAGSYQALWLGLAFVLLAGFFREYDQESLLHEPWYLFIPLLASLGLSLLLWLTLRSLPECRYHELPPAVEYRRLLTCLWMTAPLAVVYAVPVERFLSDYEAVRYNLYALGIVAAWRVLLFSRVASVLYGTSLRRVLFPLLLLSDTVMIVALVVYPLPLIEFMGGIQLTETESLINEVRLALIQLGVLAWPVLLIGTSLQAYSIQEPTLPNSEIRAVPVTLTVWAMCGFGLLVMLAACLITQPEQLRRYRVESLLKRQDYARARDLLIRTPRTAFPPHWEPGAGHLSDNNLIHELKVMLEAEELPDWVADVYGQRLVRWKGRGGRVRFFWRSLTEEDLPVLADFLTRYPIWSEKLNEKSDYIDEAGEHLREKLLEMIAPIDGESEPKRAWKDGSIGRGSLELFNSQNTEPLPSGENVGTTSEPDSAQTAPADSPDDSAPPPDSDN